MTKRAGMVPPSMATMPRYVTTDEAVTTASLQMRLKRAVERSCKRLSDNQILIF
ncbi:MAG: bifunctional ornithine acetyltransferase/N-acetylglutamate synthase [Bryobacteraceae bacterium]|nr:bifunctional ornithine acetyltransferase/N-acetylglutamate synthase [Bryobacteraceae bacterium]